MIRVFTLLMLISFVFISCFRDNYRQSSGASFRMIVNTGDWDSTLGTNTPGQSGDPESPFYSNLFEDWAKDEYFPVYFSKEKIKSVTYKKIILTP